MIPPSTNWLPATVKSQVNDINGDVYISAALANVQKFGTDTFLFLTLLRLSVAYVP